MNAIRSKFVASTILEACKNMTKILLLKYNSGSQRYNALIRKSRKCRKLGVQANLKLCQKFTARHNEVHGFIQIIASKHAFEFGNFNLQTSASDRLHRFFPRKVRGRTAARMAFLLMEHARDVWQHEAPPQ